ncbi:MAG: CotH kinase family protein [Planctomycetota bacterium]|jgi:hypothetical protein
MRYSYVPFGILSLAVLFGFSGIPGLCGEPSSASDKLFDPDHVVDVKIELAPKDWDLIRHEGRGLPSAFSGGLSPLQYTYVKATVTVDGKTFKEVGVRKKGFLGSLSVLRPSLKIRFDRYVTGQSCLGLKRMTLNNDKQDPSHTHQVMCYALFRKAGCPAPRCNFARVTVNGEDLGVYSHVERIGLPFLARNFKDASGNLYEVQVSDFTAGLVSMFERKTNTGPPAPDKKGPDRSDLDRVVQALKAKDADLLASLEKVIDVDAFLTFWAMEVITGHWDGYTGDRNNCYIYRDPSSGLFQFIPWGADGAFAKGHAFLPVIPKSVYAWSQIPNRLYNNLETRKLYHKKLKSLLDEVWDEKALLAEVDRIEKLVSPDREDLAPQREYIRSRKQAILAELTGDGPDWRYPPITKPQKAVKPVPVSGTFSTAWTAKEAFLPGMNVSVNLTLEGKKQEFSMVLNGAGQLKQGEILQKGTAAVKFYCIRPSGKNLFIGLNTLPKLFKKGELPFHGLETFGVLVEHNAAMGQFKMLGFIGEGKITFNAAGTRPGDKVSGSFSGLLSQRPAGGDITGTVNGGDIWKAAADGDLDAVKRFIKEGADLDRGDPVFDHTPLAWAAVYDRQKVVAHLLEAGAKTDALSRGGNTPLHSASFFGRAECAEMLIKAGANIKARNDRGETPADSLRHDRGTTLFVAGLFRMKIDFEKVTEGRKTIESLLTAKKD